MRCNTRLTQALRERNLNRTSLCHRASADLAWRLFSRGIKTASGFLEVQDLRYLSRHPQLIEEHVDEAFFDRECIRAVAGIALYVAAGLLGYLIAPSVALVIFFGLPVFYGFTSEGLHELPAIVRRSRSRRRSTGH